MNDSIDKSRPNTPVAVSVVRHPTASLFLQAAHTFLLSEPLSANVIAVVAARMAAGEPANTGRDSSQGGEQDNLWVTLEEDLERNNLGEQPGVIGVAMRTPPQPLFLSHMPGFAAATLAAALTAEQGEGRAYADLPGVTGTSATAEAFAREWTVRSGKQARVTGRMRMYRLQQLSTPADSTGEAVLAEPERDLAVVTAWLEAFHAEARPGTPAQDWGELAAARIARDQIHLWRDGGRAVSLAAVSAAAAGVARIGPVYTPPQSRRNGYGAAVTAAASAAALAGGAREVVLYADLANPTANSIYQQIGYRADHDAVELMFT